jgi:hypothetical protein
MGLLAGGSRERLEVWQFYMPLWRSYRTRRGSLIVLVLLLDS